VQRYNTGSRIALSGVVRIEKAPETDGNVACTYVEHGLKHICQMTEVMFWKLKEADRVCTGLEGASHYDSMTMFEVSHSRLQENDAK